VGAKACAHEMTSLDSVVDVSVTGETVVFRYTKLIIGVYY